MNGRLRTVTALLALLALSAYFAESVAAAWCMPMTASVAIGVDGPDDTARVDAHRHGEPESSRERGLDDTPASSCPPGMLGGGGPSCVAASLPLAPEAIRTAPETAGPTIARMDRTPGLLLVAPHFRPPRA
jgi:hypothetical protein